MAEIVRGTGPSSAATTTARHDWEEIDSTIAEAMIGELRTRLPALPGTRWARTASRPPTTSLTTTRSTAAAASARASGASSLESGGRIVYRLSGTGTAGATLRVYLERFSADRLAEDTQAFLAPLIAAADEPRRHRARTGREAPSVIT